MPGIINYAVCIMARTKGSIGKRSVVTNDRFEHYVEIYGDPLEFIFAIMANKLRKPRGKPRPVITIADQAQAAKELLAYGYSKKGPSKPEDTDEREFVFSWEQDDLFIDGAENSNTLPAPQTPITITQDID